MQKHSYELKLFNQFERLLSDFKVDWNKNDTDANMLASFINQKLTKNDEVEEKYEVQREYAMDLFEYFCDHQDRKQIIIQNFASLPNIIYESLFSSKDQSETISFITITRLFPLLVDLRLNELEMTDFVLDLETYVKSVKLFAELRS